MTTKKSTKSKTDKKGFTADERAAMKERAKELKAEQEKTDGEGAALTAIAEKTGLDQTMAERIHEIIKATAPTLSAKTWYGMPAYADKDGKIVCFFQPAQKFKYRYATLGFNEAANLDDGGIWPIAYALTELTAAEEKKITALIKQAIS
jgi:uncharacterized protein YdhG (YjbR/CyaY superfamily)